MMRTRTLPAAAHSQLVRWWGWLLLWTVAFELLITARYFSVADLDNSAASLVFRATMLVAHFSALTAILLSPLLALVALRVRAVVIIPLGALCSALILAALLVDTQVYQLYRFHINAGVLNLLLGGAARETFVFPGVMYLQAVLAGGALLLVQGIVAALCWRHVRRNPGLRTAARAVAIALSAAMVGFHGTHVWADVMGYEPLLEQTSVLPLPYAATAKRALRKLGVNVRTEPLLAADPQQDRSGLAYPLRPLECRGPENPPNIIVILIDSWRFDALTAEVTPNIAEFAQRSVHFLDHYSGGNATRIGVFSLFYSIPGTYWHRILAERQPPVFMQQLLRQDYDVRVFRSAPLYSPEFDRTIFSEIENVRLRSQGEGPADWDRDLTDDFRSFLSERRAGSPFFALLFYDSPHSFQFPEDFPLAFQPSIPDVNYFELNNETPPEPLRNRYLNSVRYVDSLVGEALTAIERAGLLEDSVVIVTGDHGQEFNDNGLNYWGHSSNFTRYQTGVPFLIYAPGLSPGVRRHRTTHFDVLPTLMREYLGCTEPFSTYSVGRPLFEEGGRDTMVMSEYTDFAIVQPDLIAVIRRQGMEIRDADYAVLEGRLEPGVIKAALEQKSRFYKSSGLKRRQESGS